MSNDNLRASQSPQTPSTPLQLDPSADEQRALLEQAGERIVSYLATIGEQPTHTTDTGAQARSWVDEPLPERGMELASVLQPLFEQVIPCSLNTASPGYLAYVPGGGLFSAAVGEMIAASVNRYVGMWTAAPGAVELEMQVIRWLGDMLQLPCGTLGVLTTGGSLSNWISVVTAREQLLREDHASGVAYVSTEVHHSVTKAIRLAGIRRSLIRRVPVDNSFRMQVDRLEEMVEEDQAQGLVPFFVCGSAGTVNTGSIDPLQRIAAIARRKRLWFHVDAAYGGFFRIIPELSHAFAGLEEADSISVDPHKGLFLAYGTGALLVKDISALHAAFSDAAEYLPDVQSDSERIDFAHISPELSRDWRGLRLWLPLKLHGVNAFREALKSKRELACEAHEALRSRTDVEIATPPELSLFAFRKLAPERTDDEENHLNRELIQRINESQRVLVTGTNIGGKEFIRLCVLHLRTDRERVREATEIIHSVLDQMS